MSERPEVTVKLVGEDGNAFAILGNVSRAMKKAGWTKQQIDEYLNEAMSGDYNHLLSVTNDYVNII